MPVQIHSAATMPPEPLRMMLYGAPRVGKTTFASSAPRPLFLSVGLEGGDKTLQGLRGVDIARIKTTGDMKEVISGLQRRCQYGTIVVDSTTFYADVIINEIVAKNRGPMKLQDWGVLDIEVMRTLLPVLHALPAHVIWIALEKVEKDEATGAVGRVVPMLGGQQAHKLAAVTDLIARIALMPVQHQDGVIREARVLQVQPQMTLQGPIMAGGRFANAFPYPYIMPTWDALMSCIGTRVMQTAHGTAPMAQAAR